MESPQTEKQLHPLANYQFNADELRVLKECNTESFFQRSLPIGTGLGIAAFFGVKNGYLKPNLNYGSIPKVVVGVIVGYFFGKFSYQKKCMEKLMKLPNSKLAEILRGRQKTGFMETITSDGMSMGLSLSPFTSSAADIYSDEQMHGTLQSNALNLDTDRPSFAGLDDIYRPSMDNSSYRLDQEIPYELVKTGTTYEELRSNNREEYIKKQQRALKVPSLSESSIKGKEYCNASEPEKLTVESKNKYGDTW